MNEMTCLVQEARVSNAMLRSAAATRPSSGIHRLALSDMDVSTILGLVVGAPRTTVVLFGVHIRAPDFGNSHAGFFQAEGTKEKAQALGTSACRIT